MCTEICTETIGLLGTGAQDGHFDFHTAPELCVIGADSEFSFFVCVLAAEWLHTSGLHGLQPAGWACVGTDASLD